MPLLHDFVLLNKNEFSYDDCCELVGKVSYDVSIHDDLIIYFNDFLKWIPTYNPSLKVRHTGLNYYGVTVIDGDGAALLHKDLKCKAPLIEPNLRRNLGKWST